MKRARPAERSSAMPAKKRLKPTTVVPYRRSMVVPGVTRIGGAYERSLMARYGGETKYIDIVVNNTNPNTNAARFRNTGLIVTFASLTGTLQTSMTQIPQGTSANTRIGGKIRPYQIRFRGSLEQNSGQPAYYRILLVQDNQANGALPSFTEMFKMNNSGRAIDAFYNMDNVARFKFLKDKIVDFRPLVTQMRASGDTTTQTYQQAFKLNHKLKGNPVMEYSGITGEITEVRSINYLLVAISSVDAGAISAIDPAISGHVRFYFKE